MGVWYDYYTVIHSYIYILSHLCRLSIPIGSAKGGLHKINMKQQYIKRKKTIKAEVNKASHI